MRSASRPSLTPTMARWKLRWLKQLRRSLIRPTLKLTYRPQLSFALTVEFSVFKLTKAVLAFGPDTTGMT
jgi:hypothetical protein